MRSDEACMDNANLGGAVINNLNYARPFLTVDGR
jgi:hypothetical protein